MLAAAAAISSNSRKYVGHAVPSCSAIRRRTTAGSIGGAAFCSLVSASRYGATASSGIAASNTDSAWPNFIAPPLSVPSTSKTCSAVRRDISALTSSLVRPISR